MLLSKAVEQERGGAQRIIGVAGSVDEDAIMTSEGRSAFLWGVCLLTLRLPALCRPGAGQIQGHFSSVFSLPFLRSLLTYFISYNSLHRLLRPRPKSPKFFPKNILSTTIMVAPTTLVLLLAVLVVLYPGWLDRILIDPFPSPSPAKSAVLISGTSSGLGRNAAFLLANNGFTVLGTVRSAEDADKLRDAWEEVQHASQSGEIIPIKMDVASDESVAAAADDVRALLEGEAEQAAASELISWRTSTYRGE